MTVDVIPRMLEALQCEVSALRKRRSGSRLDLRDGERLGQEDRSWLYRFVINEEAQLRDDTPVQLLCGDERVPGSVVSFRKGVLLLALERDFGPNLSSAKLDINDSFLIERLRDRLEKVRSGEWCFDQQAADRVVGHAPITTHDAEVDESLLRAGGPLNNEQILAIRRSLGSDTTFVWGPPGTGKTTTLARIVEAHYRAGRTVLLVSNTNIAVDTATEKLAERLSGDPDFDQGVLIRHGPVVKPELRTRFGPQVIAGEVADRMGEALRREKQQLEIEVADLVPAERSLTKSVGNHEKVQGLRENAGGEEAKATAALLEGEARRIEAERTGRQVQALRTDLDRAHDLGAIRRFLSGLNVDRLERDIALAERARTHAQDARDSLTREASAHAARAHALRAQIESLAAEIVGQPSLDECRQALAAIRARLEPARARIAALDRELAALSQQVLANCQILATTIYRTYVGKDLNRRFDVTVIDEASMLVPPLVYWAAGLSSRSVTVAGDFRQLPPIVAADEPPALAWLKRDVFEMAGIPDRLRQAESPPELVALRTQYRMRAPIADLVSRIFYPDHPLTSHENVERAPTRFPFGEAPIQYIDTAAHRPWTSLRVGTYSRYNLLHALLVREIVLNLRDGGYLPSSAEPNDVVGAVAPYAAQAALIQSLLEDRLGPWAVGMAATVHRFQGNEKSAMVIDLTDSFGTPLGRFFQAEKVEEDGARLLNVALSRARDHLILIGNFRYLRAKASANSILRRLLDFVEAEGTAIQLRDLLPIAERGSLDGLHVRPATPFDLPEVATGAFTEASFYPAFLRDLEQAALSVTIFSPFATPSGTARWIGPLRLALSRGVAVRVVTRPPLEGGDSSDDGVAELVAELRAHGVAVDLRSRMHEKIAIVDARTLWHGSLNILSHRDTYESMLRIESPSACTAVGRFVTARPGRKDAPRPLHAAENPPCPKCGQQTVWKPRRDGIAFDCADSECTGHIESSRRPPPVADDGRPNVRPTGALGSLPVASTDGAMARPCPQPDCGGRLVERRGRFGPFLGCTNFPRGCRYTEQLQ